MRNVEAFLDLTWPATSSPATTAFNARKGVTSRVKQGDSSRGVADESAIPIAGAHELNSTGTCHANKRVLQMHSENQSFFVKKPEVVRILRDLADVAKVVRFERAFRPQDVWRIWLRDRNRSWSRFSFIRRQPQSLA